MCGQAEGAARRAAVEGGAPDLPDTTAAAHRNAPATRAGTPAPRPPGRPFPGPLLEGREEDQPGGELGSAVHIPVCFQGSFTPYLSSTPQITAQEGPQQEQKIPEEAGSEGAQKSQEAVISGTRVDCHLSPGWLCDPRWQLNLSVPSCL